MLALLLISDDTAGSTDYRRDASATAWLRPEPDTGLVLWQEGWQAFAADREAKRIAAEAAAQEAVQFRADTAPVLETLQEAHAAAVKPLPAIEEKPPVMPDGGRQVDMEVTAYCDHGDTADGTYTVPGVVAAGPSFAFGTVMEIPGYGMGVIHDRGGAVSDNVVDVWMASCDEAINWGRRYLTVTVY